MLTFEQCLRHTGISLDEELEQFYLEFCANRMKARFWTGDF